MRKDAEQRVRGERPPALQQNERDRNERGDRKHAGGEVEAQKQRHRDAEQRRMRHRIAEIGHAPPHDETAERPGNCRNADACQKCAHEEIVKHGRLHSPARPRPNDRAHGHGRDHDRGGRRPDGNVR